MSRCSSIGVDGVRARRVGRRRQHVRLAARLDDVGRVAAARAFGVVGVDRAAPDRVERRLRRSRIRSACRCGSRPARPSCRRPRARRRSPPASCPSPRAASSPIAPASTCSTSGAGRLALPLPRKPRFIGNASAASSIRMDVPRPGRAGRRERCRSPGPVPPPIIVVTPDISASSICCGQMKWMCESMPPAVTIMPSPAMISVAGADHDVDARLDVRVAGLAELRDLAVLDRRCRT